jgi:hypothetical protein
MHRPEIIPQQPQLAHRSQHTDHGLDGHREFVSLRKSIKRAILLSLSLHGFLPTTLAPRFLNIEVLKR